MTTRREPAAVHANDPASSYQAESRVTKSGKRRTDREVVLAVMQKFPGRTAAELHASNIIGIRMDCITVRRRLWDLNRLGFATKGPQRKCRIAGTLALTWYPMTVFRGSHYYQLQVGGRDVER